MTYRDESVEADADLVAPSTRRSRRDGEREAAHRALYADSTQPASAMRVVDGGSPMYRTRREMRESASRLARDLPVIVEPVLEVPAASEAPAASEGDAATMAQPVSSGRRARRLDDDVARSAAEPAPVEREHAVAAPSADEAETTGPISRRARRLAALAAAAPVQQSADAAPAPSAPAVEIVETATADGTSAAVIAEAVEADVPEPVAAPTVPFAASAPVASAPAASSQRVVTRAERRAAQAASSTEVSAAVAAVLGGEQEDAASTPVRSPLRREARPPKPAPVVARRTVAHAPVVRPSRRVRSGAARRAVQRLAAAGVILSIGSFVAVTSLPAQAFSPAEPSSTTGAYGDVEVEQQLDVTSGTGAHGAEEVTAVLTRDDFGVEDALATARMTPEELSALQASADGEEIGPYYGGDPAMPGVWSQLETSYTQSPFPSLAEVPVSSGFGYRWGSFHGGVDLIPGAGTPVFPIANGVVIATWQGNNPGGGGYEVIVEHNIDGQYFQSWYPHMQAGSIQVEPGQVVDITTQLGAVGSTGRSTGAHLHLEIKNGDYISVDPLVWLATREQILEP